MATSRGRRKVAWAIRGCASSPHNELLAQHGKAARNWKENSVAGKAEKLMSGSGTRTRTRPFCDDPPVHVLFQNVQRYGSGKQDHVVEFPGHQNHP